MYTFLAMISRKEFKRLEVKMIKKVQVYRFEFQLEKPFVIALGTIPSVEVAIVVIEDHKGRLGIGEGCPAKRITGETIDTVLGALKVLAPTLIGEDPLRIGYLADKMDGVLSGNTAAKAALDIALHDLAGKILGVPVWKLLGGHTSDPISTDYTVGIDDPEKMAREAARLVEEGFREIKVKVGEDPERDVERVGAIRKAVGDRIVIRIDANQGWSPQEAVWALREMEPSRVQLVEQPVPHWDLEGLRYVRERSPIPVMADEAVHLPQDALRAIRVGAVDYINIKLMKAGGL
ncbi:TPA: dipeptide epimerase, partial [Candidatus Micrarchaeota archaeon]|nr:dipeptide epimerase [Candidatus Micrarchaeota archaeon]